MTKVPLTIFANFYIDDRERFLRLKDSFNSMSLIDIDRFVINVRGKYSEQVVSFLEDQTSNVDIFSLDSEEGWFYDTSKIMKFVNTKFLLIWVEDHICLRPEKINSVVSQMSENNIDILTYTFWCNGAMLQRYSNLDQEKSTDLTFFDHTTSNNSLVQNNKWKIKSFIVAFPSIIEKNLFERIIEDRQNNKKWNKKLPFDFEKSPYDESWLPIRRGVPKYEIFASIDDDLNAKNSSLQNRGLYPIRELRKTYAQKERRVVILLRKIKNNIKRVMGILVNTLLTPYEFRLDYLNSFLAEKDAIKIVNSIHVTNYKAIKYLESRITAKSNIFEYCSGGSSQYWLKKHNKLVSVEHSKDFYSSISPTLDDILDYKLVEPEIHNGFIKEDYSSYLSCQSKSYKGYSFEKYVKSIDSYDNEFFDTIFINGRARVSCVFHSISKLKPGGMLVLSNSDGKYYKNVINYLLAKWDEKIFRGSVRGNLHLKQTSIFHKPA